MDSKYDWFIGSQTNTPEKSIIAKTPITKEDIKKIANIINFLSELTETSPYKELCDKYDDFNKYISNINKDSSTKDQNYNNFREIYNKLDNLLSSLRAFDDRTKHNLSTRYGKKSIQFNQFKLALSYEFDHVFAYRFCCQLRNYSQHLGTPITKIESTSSLKNDIPINSLKISIDSKILLKKYHKWQTKVKSELQNINGIILLEPILKNLMLSCSRAFAKYLIIQESEIKQSIVEIKKIIGNVEKNEYPIIIGIKKEVKITKKLNEIKIKPTKIELIKTLEHLLQQAHDTF